MFGTGSRAPAGHAAAQARARDVRLYPLGYLRRFCDAMTGHVVILGGGTGGTLAANRLRRRFRTDELAITVVDQDDRHVYQPGLLFVPFGLTHVEDIVRPRQRQLRRGIDFIQQGIDHVEIDTNMVQLDDGARLAYDVLVVATGASLVAKRAA